MDDPVERCGDPQFARLFAGIAEVGNGTAGVALRGDQVALFRLGSRGPRRRKRCLGLEHAVVCRADAIAQHLGLARQLSAQDRTLAPRLVVGRLRFVEPGLRLQQRVVRKALLIVKELVRIVRALGFAEIGRRLCERSIGAQALLFRGRAAVSEARLGSGDEVLLRLRLLRARSHDVRLGLQHRALPGDDVGVVHERGQRGQLPGQRPVAELGQAVQGGGHRGDAVRLRAGRAAGGAG